MGEKKLYCINTFVYVFAVTLESAIKKFKENAKINGARGDVWRIERVTAQYVIT